MKPRTITHILIHDDEVDVESYETYHSPSLEEEPCPQGRCAEIGVVTDMMKGASKIIINFFFYLSQMKKAHRLLFTIAEP